MNIRKYISILFITLLLVGCGKKEIVGTEKVTAQTRKVAAFSSLDIKGYYNVSILIGKTPSVVIKVNANLLPYIESTVKGKTLTVATKRGYLLRPQGIPEVDIVVPALSKIRLSGNNAVAANAYTGDSLELELRGYNQFIGQGVVNSLSLDLSGNSTIDTQKLLANKVTINSNGYAKIQVNAKDQLKVTISGNGIVNFSGNPKISQTINGSGSVTKLRETVNK